MIDNIQTITCTLTRYQNWWRVPEITKIDKKTKMEKKINNNNKTKRINKTIK